MLKRSYKYTIWGLVSGIFFITILWFAGSIINNIPFSLTSFAYLHNIYPIFWYIDLLPLIMGLLAFIIEKENFNFEILLEENLKHETQKSQNVLDFVNNLIQDNFDFEIEDLNNGDKLSGALVELRNKLKQNKAEEIIRRKEDDQRNWISEGLAKFSELLRRNNNDLKQMSYEIIIELVKYIGANQGGVFLLEESKSGERYFMQTAAYAYDRKKFANKRIEWGEGLIGTCALERKSIYLTEVPDSYLNITSGLGKANPRSVLIVPLQFNNEIHGIIELASFEKFEKFEIEFVERIAESTASTLASVKINLRTADLLKESREQAEILAAQEEQMRQNMEELQATQEEAARQSEKFISFTNSVNHTLIRAEYLVDGTLIYANTKFLNKLGYASNLEVEGKHISMFINKKDCEWFEPLWEELANGGKHFEGYMKHVTKLGQDLWTMATYTCVRKEDGNVEKILFLAIDTTEQKKQSLDYEGQIDALNRSSIKVELQPEGRIMSINALLTESLGYTDHEMVGKKMIDFIHKEDLDNFKAIWKNVLGGQPFMGQIRKVGKNNEVKWFRGTYTAVMDMYGDVSKVIFIANDITKKKQMEIEASRQNEQLKEQEEKLRLAGVELSLKLKEAKEEMRMQFKEIERIKVRNELTLEGALDAIITINEVGTIEFFNKAAEMLWGIDRKDAIGQNVSILFDNETIENDEFVASYVKPGTDKIVGVRKEVQIKTREGEQKPVLFLISMAKVDNSYAYTAFIQNIEVELF
ncbi:MAG TPA: PAS domain S-box protein [Bacteroidales bacterium]|nr:PAS domain S-box protein [Bacteroidales bacterium]